jgi:antitoxin component YwqK of YwqJK toxin-antitoxin module
MIVPEGTSSRRILGPVRNFYDDGKLLSLCEFRASRMHGPYISYWPNGKIKEQGEYVANKKHKEWKEYDETGQLIKDQNFKAGILIEPKAGEKK